MHDPARACVNTSPAVLYPPTTHQSRPLPNVLEASPGLSDLHLTRVYVPPDLSQIGGHNRSGGGDAAPGCATGVIQVADSTCAPPLA